MRGALELQASWGAGPPPPPLPTSFAPADPLRRICLPRGVNSAVAPDGSQVGISVGCDEGLSCVISLFK
eukprot:729379-Pyramimonas_sp.AAC.1